MKFSVLTPSLVATASVATAVNGLKWHNKPWKTLFELISFLEQITGIESSMILKVVQNIEEMLKLKSAAAATMSIQSAIIAGILPEQSTHVSSTSTATISTTAIGSNTNTANSTYFGTNKYLAPVKTVIINEESGQPETPTDVQDVHF